jgi:hypothetical protein
VIGDYRTGFAVTEGFNTALAPYSFNLTRAHELLQLAGYQQTPPPIEAQVTFVPTTLSLHEHRGWITVYIQLPSGFNVNNISLSSLRLNDTIPVAPGTVPTVVRINGVPTLSVKFSMPEVLAKFNGPGGYVLMISGNLGGNPPQSFEGSGTVRIVSPRASL